MSKAERLRQLEAAGFDVPPFAVVPADAFKVLCAAITASGGSGAPATASDVAAAPLPAEAVSAVRAALRALGSEADGPLAVRSSMAGEDGARHAFAGQLDSFLNVRGEPAVLEAVRACWASALGPRVAAYRAAHGLSAEPSAVQVILQRMVQPDVAGVLFTADPVAGDRSTMVISAVVGLADALVRGDEPGQTWRIDRATGDAALVDGDGPPHLAAPRLRALADIGARVEALFGAPQDIEFAVQGDRVWLLQARPITTPIGPGPRILWDDSNIAESYSGATSPLTRSVIRDAYGGVYRQFFALMGVRHADPALLRALLGYYDGRVYYQLQNWYQALALLPGFEHNRRFMDQMMGVRPDQAAPAVENERAGPGARRWSPAELWWQLGWLVRVIRLHAGIERHVMQFLATVDGVLAEHRAVDARTLPPHALLARYRDLERRVLGSWRAPIVTDFFAMVSFGLLRRLAERWVDADGAIHNDLLAGQGAIESMEPVRLIGELAAEVAGDAALRAAFGLGQSDGSPPPGRDVGLAAAEPRAVLARLESDPALAPFRARLADYLDRYGDRCPDELKLESPNLRDDPARLVALIAAAVPPRRALDAGARPVGWAHDQAVGQAGAPPGLDTPGQGVREAAEARVEALPPARRAILRWVLAQARRHVRNRENMRFARTRVFGDLRDIFGSLGGQLAAAGVLDAPGDVFFLTVGEAWDFVEGTAITRDLRGLIALRRAEHHRDLAAQPPRRFETDGVPYLDRARAVAPAMQAGDLDGAAGSSASPESAVPGAALDGSGRAAALQGIGCCSGRVTSRARVVRQPSGEPDLAGDILVAERTDPGWAFLFPGAGGILVERGSPLSHVAIVAREMGKPTIVGIRGLMAAVQTGDRVTMDGARGEVTVDREGADADGPVTGSTA